MAEGATPLETEIDRVKKEIDELTADIQVRSPKHVANVIIAFDFQ